MIIEFNHPWVHLNKDTNIVLEFDGKKSDLIFAQIGCAAPSRMDNSISNLIVKELHIRFHGNGLFIKLNDSAFVHVFNVVAVRLWHGVPAKS